LFICRCTLSLSLWHLGPIGPLGPLGPLGSSRLLSGSSLVTLFTLVPLPHRLLSHRSSTTTTTTTTTTRSAPFGAFSAVSARPCITPFFFSHLASLFSLVALPLSPLDAFLRICARECTSHAPKSPRGPPRAHGPAVFDSLHAHAAASVRTAPRRWYGALVTCLPFHAAHQRISRFILVSLPLHARFFFF
jgi:hypothetical protein